MCDRKTRGVVNQKSIDLYIFLGGDVSFREYKYYNIMYYTYVLIIM